MIKKIRFYLSSNTFCEICVNSGKITGQLLYLYIIMFKHINYCGFI